MIRLLLAALCSVACAPLVFPAEADRKLQMAKQARELAVEAGLLKGICGVELIRPDILAVTLDGGLVGQLTDQAGPIAEALGAASDLGNPQAFVVSSASDPAFDQAENPAAVHRASYEWHNGLDSRNPPRPPYGVVPPTRTSIPLFAAVDAQCGRCIRPFDEVKAARDLAAAKVVFAYGSERTPQAVSGLEQAKDLD